MRDLLAAPAQVAPERWGKTGVRPRTVDLLTAPTAEMGIELARGRRPDAIVMDINLPGMSGVDALHALQARPETKDIPAIALTAAASERDKRRGIEAGFCQYLTKPMNVDEFVTALEAVLASSR